MRSKRAENNVSMSLEDAMDYVSGLLTDEQIRKTNWTQAVRNLRAAMKSSLTKKSRDAWLGRKIVWHERERANFPQLGQALDASEAVWTFLSQNLPRGREGSPLDKAVFDVEQASGEIIGMAMSKLVKPRPR